MCVTDQCKLFLQGTYSNNTEFKQTRLEARKPAVKLQEK